jgi:hypothetical protein
LIITGHFHHIAIIVVRNILRMNVIIIGVLESFSPIPFTGPHIRRSNTEMNITDGRQE